MEVEPFGPRAEELRAGVLATTVAAAAGAKDAKPSDFFPSLALPRPRGRRMPTLKEQLAVARAIAGVTGGRVQKRGAA